MMQDGTQIRPPRILCCSRRRFPAPWSIEDIGAAFVVKDARVAKSSAINCLKRRSGLTHEEEIELGKEMARYAADPWRFVMDMFPWDSHPELKGAAPEKWQREVLEAIRDGLPQEKVRIAC